MAGLRDSRAVYIFNPANPLAFPFGDNDAILDLGGTLATDDVNPATGALGNQDFTLGWGYGCVVDISHTGGSVEVEDKDRCNPDAVDIESLTDEFSGTIRKRHDSGSNALAAFIALMFTLRESCAPFYMLMLDTRPASLRLLRLRTGRQVSS